MIPATVVVASPLTIQPQGGTDPQPATAYTHVTGLASGQRVHAVLVDGQLYVTGRVS